MWTEGYTVLMIVARENLVCLHTEATHTYKLRELDSNSDNDITIQNIKHYLQPTKPEEGTIWSYG